jgi:hypothetical protein
VLYDEWLFFNYQMHDSGAGRITKSVTIWNISHQTLTKNGRERLITKNNISASIDHIQQFC